MTKAKLKRKSLNIIIHISKRSITQEYIKIKYILSYLKIVQGIRYLEESFNLMIVTIMTYINSYLYSNKLNQKIKQIISQSQLINRDI